MRSRRDFLKLACVMAGSRGLLRAQVAQDYKALVCVFLFGGNDGNNMVVPMEANDYATYKRGRGIVALPIANLSALSAQGKAYGLHPQLAGIRDLYTKRKVAILANTGMLVGPVKRSDYLVGKAATPRNLYSHADQVLEWQAGNGKGGASSGWGGRAMDLLQPDTSGLKISPNVSVAGNSLLLSGQTTTPANLSPGNQFGLESISTSKADNARLTSLQDILALDTGAKLVSATAGVLQRGLASAQAVRSALNGAPALKTVFPQSDLGNQLKQIAQILSIRGDVGASRQVFFCSQGGYDHHAGLIAGQDSRFSELGPALAAFYTATEELGIASSVTTFTASEFGRTFNPSSTDGADHAWGSNHFIMGGAVKGGEMYGTFPTLELQGPDDAGDRGTWIPTTSLDQYGAGLASWFGVSDTGLSSVFPNLANFQGAGGAGTPGFL